MGLLPWMAEVWLHDPRRLCADLKFACAILGLLRKSSDPTFVQENLRMVRICTLRIIIHMHKVRSCVAVLIYIGRRVFIYTLTIGTFTLGFESKLNLD